MSSLESSIIVSSQHFPQFEQRTLSRPTHTS
jgi:hypothetical protein